MVVHKDEESVSAEDKFNEPDNAAKEKSTADNVSHELKDKDVNNVKSAANGVSKPSHFNDADHEKSTAETLSTRPDSKTDEEKPTAENLPNQNDAKLHQPLLAIPAINEGDDNSDVSMESLPFTDNNVLPAEPSTNIKTKKRRRSKTFSDMCLMFEKKVKPAADSQASDPQFWITENQSNPTKPKRFRSKSLPAHAEEFLTDESGPSDASNEAHSMPIDDGQHEDEVIVNYHNSKEFYDTLKFFEEKARSGNQSAVNIVSAMKKCSNKNIRKQHRSMPMAPTDEAFSVSVLAQNKRDVTCCTDTLRARCQSKLMEFALIDQEKYMIPKGYDEAASKCAEDSESYPTDTTIRPHLQLSSTNSILVDQMEHSNTYYSCNDYEEYCFISPNETAFFTPLTAHDQESESFHDPCTYVDEKFKTAMEIRKLQSANGDSKKRTLPDLTINPEDLYKSAIFVAEKQHLDINLDPSAAVNILAYAASFLRFRMASHRIPFDSIGDAIMNFIGPYRYKPLARVMLEDLTPNDKEQLIQDLKEAVKDFPSREVRNLGQGEITNGPLYLAVSRVVNNFVIKNIGKSDPLASSGQTIWNTI